MTLDVIPKRYPTYHCYENNVLAVIGDYWKLNYMPYFWGKFGFRYIPPACSMLDSQCIEEDSIYFDENFVLDKYAGLKTIRYNKDQLDVKSFLLSQLKIKVPIGIEIDSIHLPWNQYFGKMNRKHYLSVIGYEAFSDDLVCVDGFLSNQVQKIKTNNFLPYIDSILAFERTDICTYSLDDTIAVIKHGLGYGNMEQRSQMFLNFIRDFTCISFAQDELEHFSHDIATCRFLFGIICVAWSRINFATSLEYVDQIYNSDRFIKVIPELHKANTLWEKFKGQLMKGILSNRMDFAISHSEKILSQLFGLEKSIMEVLANI